MSSDPKPHFEDPAERVNVVVFKLIDGQNGWQGSRRFLDKTGAPVTDLKIKLLP